MYDSKVSSIKAVSLFDPGASIKFILSISISVAALLTKNYLFLTILFAGAFTVLIIWGGKISILGRTLAYTIPLAIFLIILHL